MKTRYTKKSTEEEKFIKRVERAKEKTIKIKIRRKKMLKFSRIFPHIKNELTEECFFFVHFHIIFS